MSSTTEVGQKLATRAAGGSNGPSVFDLIEKAKPQLARALPSTMDPDRLARILLTEVRKTPRLAACTADSLLGACLSAAQLGLEPGPLQQVYLVPRKNKGTDEVQLLIGYRGIIDLAMRSERVIDVDAHVVYENDFFSHEHGTDPHLKHVPTLGARGEPVCAYAVARLRNGGAPFVVLSLDDIRARQAKSQSGQYGPWNTDWAAMARKSAVRALAPFLPQSTEFAMAATVDETIRTDIAPLDDAPVRVPNETDQPAEVEAAPEVIDVTPEPADAEVVDDEFPPQKEPMSPAQRFAMWAREAGITTTAGRADFLKAWSEGAITGSKDLPLDDLDHIRKVLVKVQLGELSVEKIDGVPKLMRNGLVTTTMTRAAQQADPEDDGGL